MKLLSLLLVFALMALNVRLWYGAGSLPEWHALKQQIEVQREENARLAERNAELRMDVLDLKSGSDGIEERARQELGLIRKGEVFYRIVGGQ
jgi:cell division protein FtsB